MKKRAFLIFIIMSAFLMSGYVLCIANYNPPAWWQPDPGYTDHDVGSITNLDDAGYGGSINCNCYVLTNTYYTGGKWRFRTYHWAFGQQSGTGGKMQFHWEFQPGIDQQTGNSEDIINFANWESDRSTDQEVPILDWTYTAYTKMASNQDTTYVQSTVTRRIP